jgi:hypothetical protein
MMGLLKSTPLFLNTFFNSSTGKKVQNSQKQMGMEMVMVMEMEMEMEMEVEMDGNGNGMWEV